MKLKNAIVLEGVYADVRVSLSEEGALLLQQDDDVVTVSNSDARDFVILLTRFVDDVFGAQL